MAKRITAEEKYPVVIYLWHKKLNAEGVCPYNHDLDYSNGWFYFDDKEPFHDPEMTAEAEELIKQGCRGYFRYHGMRDIPTLDCPEDNDWEE